jgi:hypothetical protein
MTSRAILNGWPIVPPSRRAGVAQNIIAPTISGSFVVGQVLTLSNGSWIGFPSLTYSVQWLRNGLPIDGATGSTYTLVDADAGIQISAAVIASNPYGNVSATTAASAVTQGGVVARLKATVATIVTNGDSRSPTFLDAATLRQKGGTDLVNKSAAASLQKYRLIGGNGQSGKRPDEYLPALTALIPLGPGVVFMWSLLNGIGQDWHALGTSGTDNAQLIIDYYTTNLKPANIRLVVGSEIGQYGMALVRRDQCDIANAMLQSQAAKDGGFNFADFRPVLCTADRIVDPANCYNLSPPTHLSDYGTGKAYPVLKAILDQIMPDAPDFTLQANGLPVGGNFTQLLPNPLLNATPNGSTSTGATGTFPGSCTYNKTGASTALNVTANPGNVLLAATLGAQSDNVRMSQTVPLANWSSGMKVRAMAIVSVANAINLAGVQMALVVTGDSIATTYSDLSVTATWRGQDGSYRYLLMTQDYVIPAYTTKNSLVETVTGPAFGAGSAGITVEQMGVLQNNS